MDVIYIENMIDTYGLSWKNQDENILFWLHDMYLKLLLLLHRFEEFILKRTQRMKIKNEGHNVLDMMHQRYELLLMPYLGSDDVNTTEALCGRES